MSSLKRREDGAIRACKVIMSTSLIRDFLQMPEGAEIDAVTVDRLHDQLEVQFLGIGPYMPPGGAVPVEPVLCEVDRDRPKVDAVKFTWPKGDE